MVEVFLSKAIICFLGSCYPLLAGQNTPIGQYTLTQRYTEQAGYGGDVLQFHEDANAIYAIHRIWENEKEHRVKTLNSNDIKKMTSISGGCINVEEKVYERLLNGLTPSTVFVIKK